MTRASDRPDDCLWSDIGVAGWSLYEKAGGLRHTIDAYLLARYATDQLPLPRCIYDLGSGTGIISHLLAAAWPESRVLGLELQANLVSLSQASAARNGIPPDRLTFLQEDLRSPSARLANQADLVVANPPFYRAGHGAAAQSDERSIARHEIHLDLPALCQAARYYLRQKGRFCVVYRAARADELIAACLTAGLKPLSLQPYASSRSGRTSLVVLDCQFEGRGDFSIRPPILLE